MKGSFMTPFPFFFSSFYLKNKKKKEIHAYCIKTKENLENELYDFFTTTNQRERNNIITVLARAK